ncbi:stalk domain-containing protein [Cellulosilyticum sp. WCF-2]|uniref:stalk domain-containing protein n=1 Tax=Cellulosilyticum sp. WCF-2 TaxID=2497860 RepID=UPI001FAA02F9|nr:stalk domain-containing protein [Cellulosilyticum sp. WCF-2]
MKNKGILSILVTLILSVSTVFATDIKLNINNQYVTTTVAPVQENGTTLVPLRVVSENLGASVGWDGPTQTITINKENADIKLVLGSKNVTVNGAVKQLSVAPKSINGTTMVPIRFVSENLSSTVTWKNGTVFVTSTNNQTSDAYYQYKGKSYRIIEVDGGDRSGSRQNNVAVDIGYGDRVYWGLTNEYGQLVYVIADKIILQDDKTEPVNSSGRYYDDEANVPGTESADLDQGHVIADSLGGVSNAYNITPQNSTLNRYGDQAYMEKVIRDAGECTDFVATITYPNTSTQIPSSYKYEYTIKGNKVVDEFKNGNPEIIGNNNSSNTVKDEKTELAKVDTNGNGKITISEAKEAGYSMPIYSDHWLYKYMDDRDGDGMVGE